MVNIKTDNPEAKKCIEALIRTIEDNGGTFHAPVTISCFDGYLSVFAPENRSAEYVIAVPVEFLPPINDYELGLKGDDFYIHSHEDYLPQVNIELMGLMLELYNITGKIKDFRQISPWLFLNHHPDLCQFILKGRNGPSIKKHLNTPDFVTNKEIIDTYFKSRILGFKTPSKPDAKKKQVIMPVIDFLNHHAQGARYRGLTENGRDKLTVKAINCIEGSEEIFTTYGPYDAMDTLVSYGYADKSANFTRSVCIDLDFGDTGKLKINAFSTGYNNPQNIQPHMKDLLFFLPNIRAHKHKYLEISHIYIPGRRAPKSLRRILTHLIKLLAPALPPDKIIELVTQGEEQIINENLEYYDELERRVDALPEDEKNNTVALSMKETVKIQKQKIYLYDIIRKQLAAYNSNT